MTSEQSNTPLSGVRVLDLTNVLAGPFCCHQLAHMGADIIKVEVPNSGDLARQLGADPALNKSLMGISFLAQNTGKRSITINLKSNQGKKLFKELVKTADVVVENFRPGVMERLGLEFEELKKVNKKLIYCAISGFGQNGPLSGLPAYDQIIQGMSGVMSITGGSDNAPLRVGYPIADTIGGMAAAFAVSASLAKPKNERGGFIDVSMLEAVMSTMGWVVSNYLVADKVPEPIGNDNFTASPSGSFRTSDGLINIAANKQEQFEAVCHSIGLSELIKDERFSERQARLKNRLALTEILEKVLVLKTSAEWQNILNEHGVPAGCIWSVPEALQNPHVVNREVIGKYKNISGIEGDLQVIRPGIMIDGERIKTKQPPPSLGEHTEEILRELGYTADQFKSLRKDKTI